MKKLGGVFLILVLGVFWSSAIVFADKAPYFPYCEGEKKNGDYQSGMGDWRIPGQGGHLVGNSNTYYRGLGSYYQCICPANGAGIQINYWNIKSKDESVISPYINMGWWRINGSDYNLRNDPYLALVLSYPCVSGVTPIVVPTVTSAISITPSVVPINTIVPSPTGVINPTLTATPMIPSIDSRDQPMGGLIGSIVSDICVEPKPASPMVLAVSNVSDKSVLLEWTKVPEATHYAIEYGTDPNEYKFGVPNTGQQTSYEIGALDVGGRYYFRVIAVADCMPGDPSNVISYPRAVGQVMGLANTSSVNWNILGVLMIGLLGMWGLLKFKF